ncbi:MAG: hypothetical protein WCJ58_05405 [bacterium]
MDTPTMQPKKTDKTTLLLVVAIVALLPLYLVTLMGLGTSSASVLPETGGNSTMVLSKVSVTPNGNTKKIQVQQKNTKEIGGKNQYTLEEGKKLPTLYFQKGTPSYITGLLELGYTCTGTATTKNICNGILKPGKKSTAEEILNGWVWDPSTRTYTNASLPPQDDTITSDELFKIQYGYASTNQTGCPMGQYNNTGSTSNPSCKDRNPVRDPGVNFGNTGHYYSCRGSWCFPGTDPNYKDPKDTKEPGMNENPSGNEVLQMN